MYGVSLNINITVLIIIIKKKPNRDLKRNYVYCFVRVNNMLHTYTEKLWLIKQNVTVYVFLKNNSCS